MGIEVVDLLCNHDGCADEGKIAMKRAGKPRSAWAARADRWRLPAFCGILAALLAIALRPLPAAAEEAAPQPGGEPAVAAVPLAAGPPAATVLGARLGDHPDKTRFVLDMTAAPAFALAAGEDGRITIDFPMLEWQAGAVETAGLIARIESGALDGATFRIVLETGAPAEVRSAFYLPAAAGLPFRFVLDLEPADPGVAADAAAPAAVPLPPPLPRSRHVRVIAIDAGHGGVDPGAYGITGVEEKTVTLAAAKALAEALAATGRYTVVMTREDDTFLRLRERVEIARRAEADLFISLHADNISAQGRVRGASVYTLSDVASDEEARLLALRENRVDALGGAALSPEDDATATILIDLAQRLTQNESRVLAGELVTTLGAATLLVNNSHREAGFAVLKAPDVPSVLVELGYLSNAEDETLLTSAEHLAAMAAAMTAGIDAYFAWLEALRRS
jgi:N-acetylmuramoyl-L-alanine amidase